MPRYYIDTEFVDDGKTIDLISIGIVASDGRTYYTQSVAFDTHKASDWVQDNVFPTLLIHDVPIAKSPRPYHQRLLNNTMQNHRDGQCEDDENGKYEDCPWRTREQIKQDIIDFLSPDKYGKPEFIGWITSYDMVAFCQIFGTMMDLPDGYPHYIKDLQFVLDKYGISDEDLPEDERKGQAHNALSDAYYIAQLWNFVQQMEFEAMSSVIIEELKKPDILPLLQSAVKYHEQAYPKEGK